MTSWLWLWWGILTIANVIILVQTARQMRRNQHILNQANRVLAEANEVRREARACVDQAQQLIDLDWKEHKS